MFEEIVSSAAKMLIVLFWVTIASAMIWGVIWIRTHKKTK